MLPDLLAPPLWGLWMALADLSGLGVAMDIVGVGFVGMGWGTTRRAWVAQPTATTRSG